MKNTSKFITILLLIFLVILLWAIHGSFKSPFPYELHDNGPIGFSLLLLLSFVTSKIVFVFSREKRGVFYFTIVIDFLILWRAISYFNFLYSIIYDYLSLP
jgi:hypothetical protein